MLNLGVGRIVNGNVRLNNAGILFFAKEPSKYFMTSKVVCAEYASNEKVEILDRKVFDDGILRNIKNSIS